MPCFRLEQLKFGPNDLLFSRVSLPVLMYTLNFDHGQSIQLKPVMWASNIGSSDSLWGLQGLFFPSQLHNQRPGAVHSHGQDNILEYSEKS